MVSLLRSFASRIIRFCSDLHREVAAGDHDPVGGLEDLLEVADRLVALDLRDHQRLAAGGSDQLARHVHVRGVLRERHRDEIGLEADRGLDVVHVLGGQRGRRQAAALAVDALAVGQHPAERHRALDRPVGHALDPHDHPAVVEQQRVAGLHVVHEVLVVEPDPGLVAELAVDVEGEAVALDQLDLAGAELADADLRALQVREHPDVAPEPVGDLADPFHHRGVLLDGAVREVDAHDVDPRQDHPLEHGRVGRGGAERGDDLRGAGDGHRETVAVGR
jgi:hypothetical protein